jgi:hypothetical protein
MKHLLWVVGLVALGPAIWFLVQFNNAPSADESSEGMRDLIIAGVFFLIALICFAIFFFIRFREEGEQDISITKF